MTARRWVGWGLVAAVPLAFLGLFFVLPTGTLIARGFSTGGSLDLSGFGEVFSRPRTWRIVGLTFLQATLGTVFAVGLGIPGAYVLYRRRFRGQWLARALVTVPFVLPTVVVGVAFRSLLAEGGPLGALHLDGTLAAIVAALVFFNYSVVVRTVGGFWAHLDPRAEQAARVLGAPPWRAFLSVTLPALVPAITAAASIVFLFCATAFGVVLILGGIRFGTIETEIWIQTTQFLNLRAASVLSVVQLVLVGAVLGVSGAARRRRERALHLTAVDAARERLGRADWAPAVVTGLVGAVLIALPMLSLVLRSLQTSHGWSLQNYANLATTGGRGVLTGTVWAALGNSVRTAFVATVIAVAVGALVALVVSRRPHSRSGRRAIETLDAVFMLPLGVSAVTVGFGFLIALHRPLGLDVDLRTWWGLVPVAQAVVAVPLVVRSLLPVLRAIDPRLRQAAAMLGASPWRVFLAVDLPMVRRALGLAIGFAFAVSLGEFGATSFLVRPDRPTLPIVIYRLIGRPGAENLGMALSASVVLAALTAAVMMLAERWRPASAMGEL